tara:strand:+ start:1132 stop:1506 length:375 start_codon:yes stop_codon:yes gene_type:complete
MAVSYIKKGFIKQHLVRYKGDTWPDSFKLWTDNTKQTPLNLTGATFMMTVDSLYAPQDSATQAFTIAGAIDATSGDVEFTPTAANTTTDTGPGTFYYDVVMSQNSKVLTIAAGKYVVKEDISNS